jgi:hypothetical protein
MDDSTFLDYPGLPAEPRGYWARPPGPLWIFVKSMRSWQAVKPAVDVGRRALGWMR